MKRIILVRIKRHLLSKQFENRVDLIYNMIATEMKRIILVGIKWHLLSKQFESLDYDSDRDDKRVILRVNKYHKQLWLELNDTYSLNK